MSISAVSSSNTSATSAPTQQPRPQRQADVQQKASSADTVSISKKAQQLAKDGDTAGQEVLESAAEKTDETLWQKA